jgi:hypothetical protein
MITHAAQPTGQGTRRVNISPSERAGRVLLGLAAIVVGIVLLTAAGAVLPAILELLLIAAGLDMLVTGTTGHCPLYQKLGRPTRGRR